MDFKSLSNAKPAFRFSGSGYYSQKCISNSLLDYVVPLLQGKKVEKKQATKEMLLGTTLHVAILEPHKFVPDYCTNEELLFVNRIKETFDADKQISSILYRCIKEVEYFFYVRDIPARMKADAIDISTQHLYDIKTISNVEDVEKNIDRYNYDRQMAFYVDALSLQKATLIFVCKKTFTLQTYTLSEKQLQEGRNKYNYLIDLIKKHDLLPKLYELI